jgi:hypothetical protein
VHKQLRVFSARKLFPPMIRLTAEVHNGITGLQFNTGLRAVRTLKVDGPIGIFGQVEGQTYFAGRAISVPQQL